ncbi:hypothetical protein Ocin01_03193 [Orchesella cincta]|uniref:Uncharacterized protein n=1 Tax=Orchesella cincta TaxID=48709 RepID=A0A1D2NE48_ORCCI|nr:hypothetical protein Ocin01_03193 [Orchesella cincta]
MERKVLLVILLICQALLHTSAEESVTSVPESVEKEGSEGISRSLSVEENSIDTKSRRNPKFGFSIPLPNVPGGSGTIGDPNATPSPTPDTNVFPGDVFGTTATLGTTALLIKGGILSGLTALKAAIFPPLFLVALVFFLIAGAAFFTCSIVNCGRIVGEIGVPGIGPGFGNPFNRHGFEQYEQHRPIYQAIDDGYKKFE